MNGVIKKWRVLFAFIFVIVFSVNFVSASSFQLGSVGDFVQRVIDSVAEIGRPVFSALFGTYDSDEFLFVKVLLLILVFVMIKFALKATPGIGEKKGVVNIISLIVSLFAIRFLSESEFVRGILLPYGVLGVALVTLLPFLIYFFFVEKSIASSTGRKIAWMLFTIVFVVLWISRATSSERLPAVANYLYLSVVVLGVALFFFDRNVKKYFGRINDQRALRETIEEQITELRARYVRLIDVPGREAEGVRERIQTQIRHLNDELHRL